ncbi:MAG: hypothetical protein ABIZ91_00940 [Gemmatimonadaceae bacterium]
MMRQRATPVRIQPSLLMVARVLTLAAVGPWSLAFAQGGARGAREAAAPQCRVGKAKVGRLTLPGVRGAYIESSTFVSAGQRVLLAGTPNYLWTAPAPGGKAGTETPSGVRDSSAGNGAPPAVARDSIFGAVRDASGRWSAVPIPAPGRMFTDPRAVASGDGLWDLIFLEIPAPLRMANNDTIVGIWHGQLRGNRWEFARRLDVPPEFQVRLLLSSRLARRGDTLTWIAPMGVGRGGWTDDALVLERIGGVWRHRRVGRPTAGGVATVLGNGPRALVLTSTNTSNEEEGPRSLFFHAADSLGAARYRVTAAEPSTVNHPEAEWSDDGALAVTWLSLRTGGGIEYEATELDQHGRESHRVRFAPEFSRVWSVRPRGSRAPALWIAERRRTGSAADSLRLLEGTERGVRTVAALSNPFMQTASVLLIGTQTLVANGPLLSSTPSGPMLETLLLSVGLECRD